MRKSTRDLFKQLEQSRKAKTYPPSPPEPDIFAMLYGWQPPSSSFPPDTLGYLADQIRLPAPLLIAQFSEAGITGLSANHKIGEDDKAALLAKLHALHSSGARSERLYVASVDLAEQLIIVEGVTEDLLEHLARHPRDLYQLSPRKFEELVAKILEDQGYDVTLTKQSRDGGYDILGRASSGLVPQLFLVECKRYAETNRVGVQTVRGLYGITEMHKANFGMIITTSSFTRDAREEKLRMGPRMALKEFHDLKSWLGKYDSTRITI